MGASRTSSAAVRGEVSARVPVDAACLLSGLLERFAKEAEQIARSAAPPEGEADIAAAHAHYLKLRAFAALLDDIGWSAEHQRTYELDIAAYGWAAVAALRTLAKRQEAIIDEQVASGDPELAGEAMSRRADILLALDLIDEVSSLAGIAIIGPTS